MVNILLCGGSGTRLWPLSRDLYPKQFVRFFEERSLYQETLLRNRSLVDDTLIVTNQEHYFLAQDQYAEVMESGEHVRYLLEPVGRNTAPAIALACMKLDAATVVFVTPSDHLVKDETVYAEAIKRAQLLAEAGNLVTFGAVPSYAETGYGYIEADVKKFHEKPDAQAAQEYVAAGNFYWNSGMFCFRAGIYLEELRRFRPDIYEACEHALESAHDAQELRICHEAMEAIPAESIDYAVMERSERIKVVTAEFGWNDVGCFDALDAELPRDVDGNTIDSGHIAIGSKNNLVITSDRTVATVDIEDLIVVDTPDALLVAKKGSSQKIKEVVQQLKQHKPELTTTPLCVHRPWGTYTVLEDRKGYKIKIIVVKPGKRLSLQKHFHRSEHWIVLSGTARVTVDGESRLVRPNESTYIPIGSKHRLENEGKIDLVIIEAQVGEYTGEDDIVRFDDDFKRI